MQLLPVLPVLASLVAVASSKATLGAACSGSGYDCTQDFGEVAVCNGARWQLSADCGDGLCVARW
ncbi:hypothetical protein BJX76DRAFT_361594 [Aspergillus varians]